MRLSLGPENLLVDFSFVIEDANRKIPRYYDKLGVYFSGGIDSTALLLLILSELRDTEQLKTYPVTCLTISKKDFATEKSPIVLRAIEEKFNTSLGHINHLSNYRRDPGTVRLHTTFKYFHNHPNTLFFIGNNKMPPEHLVKFENNLEVNYGDEKDKILYYSPFLDLHKPQILDIFYKLGHEDILPYTYSCTVQPHIPCNNCYACEERAWGFEMLKKQDPLLAQN